MSYLEAKKTRVKKLLVEYKRILLHVQASYVAVFLLMNWLSMYFYHLRTGSGTVYCIWLKICLFRLFTLMKINSERTKNRYMSSIPVSLKKINSHKLVLVGE